MFASEVDMCRIRDAVTNLLSKSMPDSAAALAEKLVTKSQSAKDSDVILFAKCFYSSGQYRRCLIALEQRDFLSTNSVDTVVCWLSGKGLNATYPSKSPHELLKAFNLAANCLVAISQYEDCISLLQTMVRVGDETEYVQEAIRLRSFCLNGSNDNHEIITDIAALYCIVGKCFDFLDHRARARRALTVCLYVDATCIEAAEYLVDNGLLTDSQKENLFNDLSEKNLDTWLKNHYELLLCGNSRALITDDELGSPMWLARCAELSFRQQYMDDAYRLARQAYTLDPYNNRGLAIYIASMVELKLKAELFYLGHELVTCAPKSAMAWYAVGGYYWICSKLDLAQKNLLKATKLDKRLAVAWVLLGHVLAAQEEGEQAISSYRTAMRLLPGEHKPMIFMAKGLIRMGHLAPALHLLCSAEDLCPNEPDLLNELAMTYMRQGSMDLALQYFERAIQALDAAAKFIPTERKTDASTESHIASSCRSASNIGCGYEAFGNYATALRKCERYEEALHWYDKCLIACPNDADCHASIGFTFHLMQRFDQAVSSYHQALAIDPSMGFCADMLNRAMEDASYFPSVCVANFRGEENLFSNFARFSKYQFGEDPVTSGELEQLAEENNRSFAAPDRMAEKGISRCDPNQSALSNFDNSYADSGFLSEMQSPSLSVAESFSRIEGRLSLGAERLAEQGNESSHCLDGSSFISCPLGDRSYIGESFT